MPFMAIEDIPTDKNVYLILQEKAFERFDKEFNPDEWQLLGDVEYARVYLRKAK